MWWIPPTEESLLRQENVSKEFHAINDLYKKQGSLIPKENESPFQPYVLFIN